MDVTTLSHIFIFGSGLVSISAILVLPLSIALTIAIIAMFRRRVRQSMEATAGVSPASDTSSASLAGSAGPLEIQTIDTSRESARDFRNSSIGQETRANFRRLAWTLALAASLLPAFMALIFVRKTGLLPGDAHLLHTIIGFGIFFLESMTPVIFAVVLILYRKARFLMIALAAMLAALWLVGWFTGTDPVGIWIYLGGFPALFVVLLNARKLRAVGPMTLAATLVLVAGVFAGIMVGTFQALQRLDVRFIREDLAGLPFWRGGVKWIEDQESFEDSLAMIMQAASEPTEVLVVHNPDAERTAAIVFACIVLLAAILAAGAAWFILRSFARSYAKHQASDQMLAVDVLVLTFSLWSLLLLPLVSWIAVVAIPSAYFGYRSLSRWRLKRHGSGECAPEPRTLLLLRVFGFDQRAQRLLEELEHRWRFLGPIRVTGSPDLAYSTIRPYEFFEFLTGRLSRRFVSSEQELRARIDGPVTADMDGSFRIQDFYCHADTWKMTVSVLGREADAVVMDLRTFSDENQGCIFEIENLIATVAVQQIVFLVDDSTDIPLLEDTLHRSWRAMPENSPNCSGAGRSITVLRSSSRIRDTADSLMGLLCSDAPIGA